MGTGTEQVRSSRVRIGYWINRGWDWFVEDLGTHILIALLPVTVFYAGFSLLFVGVFFLMGPLYAGMARVGLRKARTGQVDFRDFTDGFSRYFLPAFFNELLSKVVDGASGGDLILPDSVDEFHIFNDLSQAAVAL